MTDLILQPYAIRQNWSTPHPLEPEEWTALFCKYLSTLARACTDAAGPAPLVIGHIKLLALFAGGEYLRVSVVSPTHPPTVTGAAPAGLAEVETTLNVLVYGLPRDRLAALASGAAAEAPAGWAATVKEEAPAAAAPHRHSGLHTEDMQHAD
jgi:hypothetical protein